jgi:thiol-disulfide isomerase/thioredoxin
MKKTLLIFIISCISLGSLQSQTPLTEAIDFTATDVHGHTWNLFELLDSGQYVVIDFFFCACGPCQIAAPKINESYEYFGCNSGQVNYFAIDTGDDNAACILFDETYGVTYPTISGIEGGGTAICNDYQIPAYPTVILIAPDHSIVEQDIWPIATAQTIIDILESHGIEEHECPPPVSIDEFIPSSVVENFSIFPNPFSNKTMISFSHTKSLDIEIVVHDLRGNEVAVLYKGISSPGNHQVSWKANASIQDGLYFCTIVSNEFKVTQKLMLSR